MEKEEYNFVKRKFRNLLTDDNIDFDDISKNHTTIAIILGEPASGKTYQLKEYDKQNPESQFFTLSILRATDTINNSIKIVLIDSIDEALTSNNRKSLARDLVEFIERCKEVNKQVHFIITCRHLEWDMYFKQELKTIDKELREYELLPLDKTDINILLKSKATDEKIFWKFIEENFLEQILGNIIIVNHLLETFDTYKKESINYTTIYNDIVKKSLIKKGDDRESFTKDISLERMILITSSVFTYMLFNDKDSLLESDLEIITSELYKVEDTSITYNELILVLNTEIFKKTDNKFTFSHKTMQEYLVAYFINSKEFEIAIIKKLLAYESRFLEKYEEVIIYLTNMNSNLFNDFLNLDPFIYRRHSSLSEDEQNRLFLAVVDKLQNEEYKLYGNWKYLDGTSIVKYPKVSNLTELIQNHIEKTNINLLIFAFLLKLLEFNYSKELENFIFDILVNIEDKKKFISYIMIDNYDFNLKLLDFSYKNNLLEKSLHLIRSFETKLFQSIYGIYFQYGGKTICKYTNIDIVELFDLLECIPSNDFKHITPYIHFEDIKKWFNYLKSSYDANKHNSEYITWFIYALLKHNINISEIVNFLSENRILSLHFHTKDIGLKFDEIDSQLWDIFFKSEECFYLRSAINDLISFYDINLSDIEQLINKYPISNFPDSYIYFRTRVKNIDQLLMADETFKQYFENMLEVQKQNEKKWNEKWEDKNPELVKKRIEQKINTKNNLSALEELYKDSIFHFTTKNDFYTIFSTLFNANRSDYEKLNNQAKNDLQDKYLPFIEKLKDIFKHDKTYLILKNDLTSSQLSNTETFMFVYLFNILADEEKELLLDTKESYRKLFWHLYRYSDYMNSDFFQKMSKNYSTELELLSIEVIQLSLIQSQNKKTGFSNILKELLKSLKMYNKMSLSKLILYVKSISQETYYILEYNEKDILLEILALDKENFELINKMMLNDEENCHSYLHYLLLIDKNLAIKYFRLIYDKISTKRSIWLKGKLFLGFADEHNCHHYDNPTINHKKIQKFLCFMKAMEKDTFEDINSSTLKMILVDYYQFFNDYIHPKGTYRPDIYDYMNSKINNLWRYLESSTVYIDLLKELSNIQINNISNLAKYSLDIVYKLQAKERNITNSFYKEIFNKEKNVKKSNETHIHGDNYGVVHNQGQVTQAFTTQPEDETIKTKKELYQQWWFISLSIGIISTVIFYFYFQSIKLSIGVGIILFLISIFFNPKRRFFRVATAILATGVVSLVPSIMDYISKIFELNIHTNPLIGGLLICSSMFLYYIDSKQA